MTKKHKPKDCKTDPACEPSTGRTLEDGHLVQDTVELMSQNSTLKVPHHLKSEDFDVLHHIETLTEKINDRMSKEGKHVFHRYPLTFTLLGALGAAAVIGGLQGIVESIPFLAHNPFGLFVLGLAILIGTGSLYKRLGR